MTAFLNISLPKSLEEYVRQQVADGGFASPSDYIQALIQADRARQAQAKLEQRLIEALESGEPIEADEDFWRSKRSQLLRLR